jgi:peptidoglycan/xylan/chitin deacetylase (PgdA/CDA1 family)
MKAGLSLPSYYSTLAPFQETFLSGRPVLTYHHIGSHPRGVRIKGLYLSPKLFTRQLAQLRAAGFSTPGFKNILTVAPGGNPDRRVFLTFDDGFHDVFENALPVLRQHHFSGLLFLVSGLLGQTNEWQQRAGDVVEPLMDDAQVRDWLAAGQEIGSHTQTHPRLTQLSPAAAKEEITASKKALEDRFGVAVEHFCYPYGDWNEMVRELVKAAGYKTACTTECGVNLAGGAPLALKRFTARYPSRNFKAIWSRLKAWA